MGTPEEVDVTAYEREVARDLVRRVLVVAPAPIAVGAIFAGVDGAISAAIGLVLVATNFLVGARIISWTAQRSPGAGGTFGETQGRSPTTTSWFWIREWPTCR